MAALGIMSYPPRDGFQGYPQQYPNFHNRLYHPHNDQPTSSAPQSLHNYQRPPTLPAPSPSPQPSTTSIPDDGVRPSLPSISNLLGMTSNDRQAPESMMHRNTQKPPEQAHGMLQPRAPPALPNHIRDRSSVEKSRLPTQYDQQSSRNASATASAATPRRYDSLAEGMDGVTANSALPSQPNYVASAINNIEAQQQQNSGAIIDNRRSVPSQHANTSPYATTTSYPVSNYTASPSAMSSASYYSPTDPTHQPHSSQHIYNPQTPTGAPATSNPPANQQEPNPTAANPWEHHHYIGTSNSATFPQAPDRYICQTCNKAFSRPSSLKIHSHSHTGEKPYKCLHMGCGKAFSVKSNMKRHERGCHTGGPPRLMPSIPGRA